MAPTDLEAKRDVKLQERLAKEITALLKVPGNSACADCTATRTVRFVSVTLGTFICNRCYGIHRSVGAHVTRGKCIGLDAWLPGEVEHLRTVGNVRAKQIYEAAVPTSVTPPTAESSDKVVEKWIRAKYEEKAYVGGASRPAEVVPEPTAPASTTSAVPSRMTISLPGKSARGDALPKRPGQEGPLRAAVREGPPSPNRVSLSSGFSPASPSQFSAVPEHGTTANPATFAFADFDLGPSAADSAPPASFAPAFPPSALSAGAGAGGHFAASDSAFGEWEAFSSATPLGGEGQFSPNTVFSQPSETVFSDPFAASDFDTSPGPQPAAPPLKSSVDAMLERSFGAFSLGDKAPAVAKQVEARPGL